MDTASGTFDVQLVPRPTPAAAWSTLDLTKTWSGDLEGRGTGVMMSAGDPATGTAGYVAIETVEGRLHGRAGSFCLQQFGTMLAGAPTLTYMIVPGSGTDELEGIAGALLLTVDDDGVHGYELSYELP